MCGAHMLGDRRLRPRVCAGGFGEELEGWEWHPSSAEGLRGVAREAWPWGFRRPKEGLGGAHKHREAQAGAGRHRRCTQGGAGRPNLTTVTHLEGLGRPGEDLPTAGDALTRLRVKGY